MCVFQQEGLVALWKLKLFAFLAGANSIFGGEKLLVTSNPGLDEDQKLFKTLGLKPIKPFAKEMNERSTGGYAEAALS